MSEIQQFILIVMVVVIANKDGQQVISVKRLK